jgi:uncharacterized protein YuzE
MRVTYDPETKAAYIYLKYPLSWGEAARTVPDVAPGVNLDFDADGHLIGIELLSPNRLHPDLMAIAVKPGNGDKTP